jgi:hypothetical protein
LRISGYLKFGFGRMEKSRFCIEQLRELSKHQQQPNPSRTAYGAALSNASGFNRGRQARETFRPTIAKNSA